MSSRADTVTATVVSIAAVLTLLVVGKALLLPLAVAVMIWYVIDALAESFRRLEIAGRRPLAPIGLLLAFAVIALAVIGTSEMIGDTVRQVSTAAPGYKDNLIRILDKLSKLVGMEIAPAVKDFVGGFDIGDAVGRIARAILSLAGDAGMVAIYVLFLLIEARHFRPKLMAMFPDRERASRVQGIVDQIQRQIRQYLLLKSLVSAATGILSYVVLRWVGVDYAVFWALLIFLLNYIPTIGSLVGVAFPVILALVQFDTFTPALVLLGALGSIQVLLGNVVEPRLMGSSLNLSPLAVILALSLWGLLWGVIGMLLSVPLTVIMMIVLSNFEGTRPAAILLSEDGRIRS